MADNTSSTDFRSLLNTIDVTPPDDPAQRFRLYEAGLAYTGEDGDMLAFQPTERGWKFLLCLGDDEYDQLMRLIAMGEDEQAKQLFTPGYENLLAACKQAGTDNVYTILLQLQDTLESMYAEGIDPFTEDGGEA